ncbi:MAG: chemotaxis protein CheA [Thermoplasmata archaeon]|nr:MAG: chemotaxis protein CheA [Thermoplasmata archaeon]
MENEEYLDIFISESREYLTSLDQSILELERNPEDREILNEVFRYAHTLKGMASTMGFNNIAEVSHQMENLLDRVRKNEISISSDLIDVLLEALDILKDIIEAIAEGKDSEFDVSEILNKIKNFSGEKIESKVESKAEDKEKYKLKVRISSDCALKSVRAFMVLRNLEGLAEIIESEPSLQEIENGNFEDEFELLVTTHDPEKVKKAVEEISEIESVEISKEGENKITREKSKKSIKDVLKVSQSVRISIDKLDMLMNLVGELVIAKSRLFQIGEKHNLKELKEALLGIDRLSTYLQELVTQMRMVEVGFIFNRFPRMVRDLAKEEGKKINLIIEGKEIELDRTVLDEIGDPLVHLLRNSVDHGIETPEERIKAGKSETGTIKLVAMREKNHVKIIVEDDGRGIDPEKVKKKAVERGIITEEEASKLDDNEAINLIFTPGFSTADKVTGVSGRGVGMDVVKSKINSLGGSVDIVSQVGKGTKITLTLPLTLAIIQALLVGVGSETYAIPLNNVVEILDVRENSLKTIRNNEVINLRGKILPIVMLDKLLGISRNGRASRFPVVVVDKGNQLLGLGVDRLVGQQEIVIKSFDSILKGIRGFAGATIMGDGKVVLILDIASLVDKNADRI